MRSEILNAMNKMFNGQIMAFPPSPLIHLSESLSLSLSLSLPPPSLSPLTEFGQNPLLVPPPLEVHLGLAHDVAEHVIRDQHAGAGRFPGREVQVGQHVAQNRRVPGGEEDRGSRG